MLVHRHRQFTSTQYLSVVPINQGTTRLCTCISLSCTCGSSNCCLHMMSEKLNRYTDWIVSQRQQVKFHESPSPHGWNNKPTISPSNQSRNYFKQNCETNRSSLVPRSSISSCRKNPKGGNWPPNDSMLLRVLVCNDETILLLH